VRRNGREQKVKDGLVIGLLSVIPRKGMSRLMGRGGRLRLPGFVRRGFLRWYVRHYGVDLGEIGGGVEDYPTIVAFFTRALKEGVRPVCPDPEAVVSPVDGKVYSVGDIVDGRLPQSLQLDFAVADLLDGDDRYADGHYAVLYLSPKDYHRVHSPIDGEIVGWRYRPGRLWPVFPAATRRIRDLFARNERLIVRLGTPDRGEVACVMVGAFGVGRMATTFAELVTNTKGPSEERVLDPAVRIARAAELGRFEMGSTVVLVFQAGQVEWEIGPGDVVRMGARIGRSGTTPE